MMGGWWLNPGRARLIRRVGGSTSCHGGGVTTPRSNPAPARANARPCSRTLAQVTDYTREEVIRMAVDRKYTDAARKMPSKRTVAEQALVDQGSNQQEVRNLDHEARRQERAGR